MFNDKLWNTIKLQKSTAIGYCSLSRNAVEWPRLWEKATVQHWHHGTTSMCRVCDSCWCSWPPNNTVVCNLQQFSCAPSTSCVLTDYRLFLFFGILRFLSLQSFLLLFTFLILHDMAHSKFVLIYLWSSFLILLCYGWLIGFSSVPGALSILLQNHNFSHLKVCCELLVVVRDQWTSEMKYHHVPVT